MSFMIFMVCKVYIEVFITWNLSDLKQIGGGKGGSSALLSIWLGMPWKEEGSTLMQNHYLSQIVEVGETEFNVLS